MPLLAASVPESPVSLFDRAIETERTYFELGAKTELLPGAVLAWMPGLTASPAGAVVHRVEPELIAALGQPWVSQVECALTAVGARMARIYSETKGSPADDLLRRAGYVDRDELILTHSLQGPAPRLTLQPVKSDEDWERKLRLYITMEISPRRPWQSPITMGRPRTAKMRGRNGSVSCRG